VNQSLPPPNRLLLFARCGSPPGGCRAPSRQQAAVAGCSALGRGGLTLVECERRRQVTEGVDLLLPFGELLLGLRDRVGTGDETERGLLLVGNG